jgi:Voltage gated chloride channel
MLALKGLPTGVRPRIGEVAERLQIQHHNAVELVNRLSTGGYVQRRRSGPDLREVLLSLTAKGEKVLRELSVHHKAELRTRACVGGSITPRNWHDARGAEHWKAAPQMEKENRLKMSEPQDQSTATADNSESRHLSATGVVSTESTPEMAEPARFRLVLVSFLGAGTGLIAGFVAYGLYRLIGLLTNVVFFHRWSANFASARLHTLGPWVIVTPVIGGIIVGCMANTAHPRSKATGFRKRWKPVLVHRSRIQPRVAILKPISAAIAIGTGGPFGAEGPIIQTGGAMGSLVGQAFHSTAAERKVLLACGAAAACLATFNTPIAGVILAIELLLFEFKSRMEAGISPSQPNSAAGGHSEAVLGAGPMFMVSAMDFGIPRALPFYLPAVGGGLRAGCSRIQQIAVPGGRSVRETPD